jgi:hypothetical protein
MSQKNIHLPASHQEQANTSTEDADTAKGKQADTEEAFMRKVALFYVMLYCTLSEIASIILFWITKNAEIAIALQVPGMHCFYKILNYLFPGKNSDGHPFVQLLSMFRKHSGIG